MRCPNATPHPALYEASVAILDALTVGNDWLGTYLAWELLLLEEMGYGLDLASCAVTGRIEDLAFVSPKTGRAVSRGAAGEWADRLLPLPGCLTGSAIADASTLAEAFALTGYFLEHRLAADLGHHPLPQARQRFVSVALRAIRDM